jgi:hypothetical protein
MQIISWLLAIYFAVKFILFSEYVLVGIQFYFRNRMFSKILLGLLYLCALALMYSLVIDYIKEPDANNLSVKFWMWLLIKLGGMTMVFSWFFETGKILLAEQDKIGEDIYND